VSVSLALTGWLALEAGPSARPFVLVAGLAGAVLVAPALLWPLLLAAGLALLGTAYAVLLAIDEPSLDGRSAVVAAGLVVVAGLADWSVELRTTTPDEPGGLWRRPFWVAVGAIATLGLGAALLAVVDLLRTEGLAIEALGTAAALAAVVLLVRLAGAQRESDA
jgi:hypothetical protein